MNPNILKTVPLFSSLSDEQLRLLQPCLQQRSYPRNSFILRAGEETAALTEAMLNSGTRLHWPDDAPMRVDKHSTGGIGDTHAQANNLHYGHDNWLYGCVGYSGFNGEIRGEKKQFAMGTFRFKADGSALEFLHQFSNNSWGHGANEFGDQFGGTANNAPIFFGGLPQHLVPKGLRAMTAKKINAVEQAHTITPNFRQVDVMGGYTAAMLGQLSPMGHYRPKMWTDVFDLNVHANWRLIRSFDPLLRQSDAGRAIFVSSRVASDARMYWGPYAASKAALEQMVKIYAAEIAHTNVRANLVDPGALRTKMRAQAYPGEDPMTLKTPDMVTGVFVDLAEPSCQKNGEIVKAQ